MCEPGSNDGQLLRIGVLGVWGRRMEVGLNGMGITGDIMVRVC